MQICNIRILSFFIYSLVLYFIFFSNTKFKCILVNYLSNGEIQSDIKNNSQEEQVEKSNDKKRLLKHHHFIKCVVQLQQNTK